MKTRRKTVSSLVTATSLVELVLELEKGEHEALALSAWLLLEAGWGERKAREMLDLRRALGTTPLVISPSREE